MKIRLSFLEKEPIGIGIYRTMYQTNIRVEDMPGFAVLKDRIEDQILLELGTTKEKAKEDTAYSMDFVVKKRTELGMSVPGDYYTLVITDSGCIKRIVKQIPISNEV